MAGLEHLDVHAVGRGLEALAAAGEEVESRRGGDRDLEAAGPGVERPCPNLDALEEAAARDR